MRSAGLTHFRRSRSRVRVLLYIRPPRHRREIAAMGMKDAPCEHPSPAKTSAPAPSTFIFPRRRSHFPRMAFGDAHEDFGPPQQQLSTMGYPRKSYPHRCSPPCAKRSRPRACARVYIIYRSPVGRSRGVSAPLWERGRAVVAPCPAPPCAGWGRARAKADAPSRSNAHFPRLRSRTCPPKTAPLPAYGRITVRKGGSAQGNPRSCPCVLPASARLRPRPRPLVCRITVRKGGSAQGNPRSCPCVLPASARLRPRPRPLMGVAPCVLPAAARLPLDPARLWAKCRVQRRKCTRPTPPLPVRTPRVSPPTARPRPLMGESQCAMGEGEGKGGRPLA